MTKTEYTAAVTALLDEDHGWADCYADEISYGYSRNLPIEVTARNINALEGDEDC